MRFSDWRHRAPTKDALGPNVIAVIEPILELLGARDDSSCWIVWGEDPGTRFLVFTISDAGLIQANVRVNVPQEGPRASGKLVRWSRVQTGELGIEMVSGHHIISFQLEGQVLRGSDSDADEIGAFALDVFAAIDGRVRASRAARPGATRRAATAAKPAKGGSARAGAASRSGSGGKGGSRAAAPKGGTGVKGAEMAVRLPGPRG